MSSHSSQRLSLKATNDVATREAMTQRRQEWAARIRKSKKDHVLAMKRRYVPPLNTSPMKDSDDAFSETDVTNSSLVDLANRAIQNPTLHLEAFETALSRSATTRQGTTPANDVQTHPSMTLKPEDLINPLSLIDVLAGVLVDATMSAATKLAAARILTNLPAMVHACGQEYHVECVSSSFSVPDNGQQLDLAVLLGFGEFGWRLARCPCCQPVSLSRVTANLDSRIGT
jgi:hypothetical protein